MAARIPPIQCLLTFEALARLRSVTQTSEELCVTPSAVSHRIRQLEQILGTKLFGRADFSLTTEGSEYLAHVRDGLATLQKFPSQVAAPGRRKLRVAVTPTFARSILMPRLRQFTEALTNWYVRRSRSRFWEEDRDAIDTLHTVLEVTGRLAAPPGMVKLNGVVMTSSPGPIWSARKARNRASEPLAQPTTCFTPK